LITAGAVCQTAEHWLGTARARIGFAVDRLLIFGTAGGASGDIKAGLNPPGTYDASNNFGWTAGGGVEGAITENWTAKIEYLHVDLGNATCPTNCGLAVPMTVPLTENLIRAGINYKFGF
jgi:outer membrane immunogenic protein